MQHLNILYKKGMTSLRFSINYLKYTFLFICISTQAEILPPPSYQLLDRHQVNMATGQLSPSLTDLSIGGGLGLTHSISTDSSEFVNRLSSLGPRDSFAGGLRDTKMPQRYANDIYIPDLSLPSTESRMKLTSYFGSSSTDFYIDGNGTYTAKSDLRHTLEYHTNLSAFVHTHPDGKKIYFKTSSNLDNDSSLYVKVNKVVESNGFTIYITSKGDVISSVSTNTGYQLKYNYQPNNNGLNSVHQQEYDRIKNALGYPDVKINQGTWSSRNPSAIIALNNTLESCDAKSRMCETNNTWPKVTYQWPTGMPAAMYLGDTEFKVTDAENRTTIYKHQRFDKAINHPSDIVPNLQFIPRITQIKHAGQTNADKTYEYYNQGTFSGSGLGIKQPRWHAGNYGVLNKVTREGVVLGSYNIGIKRERNGVLTDIINKSSVYKGISSVESNAGLFHMYQVNLWDKYIYLEEPEQYNRVKRIKNLTNGTNVYFEYDTRGNVETKTTTGTGMSNIVVKAEYPPSPCANPKTCNQATSITDARGKTTSYTYHAESGQVKTVTYPANEQGKVKVVSYTYTLEKANYKIDGSTISESPDGIWLLETQSYCANSNYNGTACLGDDEVVTKYQYEPGNLSLVGTAVTADGKTLRTCYSYDIYGNNIGTTLPKANLPTCPN